MLFSCGLLLLPLIAVFSPNGMVVLFAVMAVSMAALARAQLDLRAIVRSPLALILGGLLAWSLVSAAWAPEPLGSLDLWARFAVISLVGLVLVACARNLSAESHGAIQKALMIGGVALLVVVAKVILPFLLRESLRGRRLEVMMLVGISAALAAAIVAQGIGFSLEMGAFLAGFVLAGTPFRHQLSGQIGPLRDIFSALFFTTVGMKVAPAIVMEHWWVILLGVAALVVIKTVVIGGTCWAVGALPANAIIVGFALAQAGEFSLILLGESADLGIFRNAEVVVPSAIAIVVISLILTPALHNVGRRLARNAGSIGHAPWVRSPLLDAKVGDAVTEGGPRHIIIAGFGPIGRRIAEVLEKAGVSYTIIELNPDTVAEQLRRHRSIVFGDVANPQVLESAGLGHADALILTVPDEDAVLRACVIARRRSPRRPRRRRARPPGRGRASGARPPRRRPRTPRSRPSAGTPRPSAFRPATPSAAARFASCAISTRKQSCPPRWPAASPKTGTPCWNKPSSS